MTMPETLHTTFCASSGFEAACIVGALPEGHRARRLHGHSFVARLRAEPPAGWAPFPGGEVAPLREALEAAVAPLDYAFLNEKVPHPTDENLARWVRARLLAAGVPGLTQVGVQSTRHSGVDLTADDHAHLWRRYSFQAAHQLPNVPAGHQCGRMHGHGFEVILHADTDLQPGHPAGARDFVLDYDHLDALWAPLHAELDHACLNDLPGLGNPTSEVLTRWLWERIKPQLPALSWVTVFETGSSGSNYDGEHFRIWKEFTLDSALTLRQAPGDHRLRRLHGHTYTLRLHLCAPLHEVLGWTVDFGDVKALFNPIFKRLDHHPLHEIEGLADADTGNVARWILAQARTVLPQVDRVDLEETRGCGAIVCAGPAGPALPV